MIYHKHKFIFIHTEKTGGTSIEKCFVDNADEVDVEYKHHDAWFYFKNFLYFDDYFKFTFVRNPWDRLVSAYHFYKNDMKLIDFTFEEFIEKIGNKESMLDSISFIDYAIKPCFHKIRIKGNIVVDFVGKFEKLQEDFDYVCNQIGVETVKLPHVKKTVHDYYTEYYNEEMIKIVEQAYVSDITRFDYKFGE
jgi:hypothetical protein